MADTTTTTLTELIQASIGEARVVASQGADLASLIVNRPLEVGKGSATFPIYDEEVMASVAEGVDLTSTAFDTTAATITPGERGLMTNLTDLAKRRAGMQVAIDLGGVMGEAYKAVRNQDIYALCDGFSTALGTTNVDITEALIQQAVAQLRANKAPGRLYMPVTPWVLQDLLGLYTDNTKNVVETLRADATFRGVLPIIHGVIPVLIDNLASGTGTGGIDEADTKTAIFSEFALGYVSEWDFKIETERNASLRAEELVATASYGVGEIKDSWGIELLVDNKD
jgi:hypothetical protein